MFRILHEAARPLTTDEWNERARAESIGVNRPATLNEIRSALRTKGIIQETMAGWTIKQPST